MSPVVVGQATDEAPSTSPMRPSAQKITLIFDEDHGDLVTDWHLTEAPTATVHYPVVLDACDLSTAQRLSSRLDADLQGRAPLPLLRLLVRIGEARTIVIHRRPDAIVAGGSVEQVAQLIADAARAGVAVGAVVDVAGERTLGVSSAIADALRRAGYDVCDHVDGWDLSRADNGAVARADDPINPQRAPLPSREENAHTATHAFCSQCRTEPTRRPA